MSVSSLVPPTCVHRRPLPFRNLIKMAAAAALHVEGFNWTAPKTKLFILGTLENALSAFQKLQQENLFRGRKVLVLVGNGERKPSKQIRIFQQSWDFVLRIRANVDYNMLATYLRSVPKPVSVLWIGSEVPAVFLTQFDTDTRWIGFSGVLPSAVHGMSHILIDPALPLMKYKDWFVSQPSTSADLLAVLNDLRERKAGIVYSVAHHTIQWYDATGLEGAADDITIKDIQEIMEWSAEQLRYLEVGDS